jgi:hypothetical protein
MYKKYRIQIILQKVGMEDPHPTVEMGDEVAGAGITLDLMKEDEIMVDAVVDGATTTQVTITMFFIQDSVIRSYISNRAKNNQYEIYKK